MRHALVTLLVMTSTLTTAAIAQDGTGHGNPKLPVTGMTQSVPTPVSPTTVSPTTVSPTTVSPTTVSPTVLRPTILRPTVLRPNFMQSRVRRR